MRYERLESRAMLSVNGDFNGDGFDDLAVGVPNDDFEGFVESGAVNVIYGSNEGLTTVNNQYWHQGVPGVNGVPASNNRFGAKLAIGDFNGDGFSDLAVGVPGKTVGGNAGAGAVNILYGSAAGLTATGDQQWNQDSSGINDRAELGDNFGSALAAGDFNGDGRDDLAIGAASDSVGDVDGAGLVNVLYGSASGLTNVNDQHWHQNSSGINDSAQQSEHFGFALTAGDFNGDGRDDLAIGVPQEEIDGIAEAGQVQIIYGSASGLTGSEDVVWNQDSSEGIFDQCEPMDAFGTSLAAGDFNDDGFDDLSVGVVFEDIDGADDVGAVHVLFGSAAGITSNNDLFWHQGTTNVPGASEDNDLFGFSLAAGDYDGDGRADLVVGIPAEDVAAVDDNGGAILVIYGYGLIDPTMPVWHQNLLDADNDVGEDDFFGLALA